MNTHLRLKVKIILFAIIYGMSFDTLSRKMNISKQTAKDIIRKFLHRYYVVNKFMYKLCIDVVKKVKIFSILKKRFMFKSKK